MLTEISVLLLVGGKGTRMGERTQSRQKLMLEVDGKPVLVRMLDGIAAAFDTATVIMSTGYRDADIRNYFGTRYRSLTLQYLNDPDVQGTLWGVALAQSKLQKPFVFMGGDVLLQPSHLNHLVRQFDETRGGSYMGVISGATHHEPALRHAIIQANETGVLSFDPTPRTNCEPDEFRDIHLGCFQPELLTFLNTCPQHYTNIENGLHDAVQAGLHFDFLKYDGPWYHFKTPADFELEIVF